MTPYALWRVPAIWWWSKLTENTIDPCPLRTDCAASWPFFEGHHMTVTTYDFPLILFHGCSFIKLMRRVAFLMGRTDLNRNISYDNMETLMAKEPTGLWGWSELQSTERESHRKKQVQLKSHVLLCVLMKRWQQAKQSVQSSEGTKERDRKRSGFAEEAR